MVFTRLSSQEKDAFFGLLDEYFQSRPELFGQNDGLAGTGPSTTGGASGRSNNPYAASMPTGADAAQAAAMAGRVAAATLAFSGGQSQPSSQSQSQPPPLSRRIGGFPDASPSVARTSLERAISPGSEVDKLTTKKVSAFSAFRKPEKTPGVTVSIPSAFTAPKSTFGPPPMRRLTSETGSSGGGGGGGTIGTHVQRQAAPEPEPGGDWAEVLYEYHSEDPGDLAIEAGTRVLVTDKSSNDWWTGRVEGQGREGLFPASYVKLL